jgi:hypothetical protein
VEFRPHSLTIITLFSPSFHGDTKAQFCSLWCSSGPACFTTESYEILVYKLYVAYISDSKKNISVVIELEVENFLYIPPVLVVW